jgi:hypothetical protein
MDEPTIFNIIRTTKIRAPAQNFLDIAIGAGRTGNACEIVAASSLSLGLASLVTINTTPSVQSSAVQ